MSLGKGGAPWGAPSAPGGRWGAEPSFASPKNKGRITHFGDAPLFFGPPPGGGGRVVVLSEGKG